MVVFCAPASQILKQARLFDMCPPGAIDNPQAGSLVVVFSRFRDRGVQR